MGAVLLEAPGRKRVVLGVPRAAYKIEIGWGQTSGGLFTFGTSQFGSATDLLAADSWSAAFAGPYDDVSADGREFTIDRGRDNDLTTFKAGQLNLTLRDPYGLYNPLNSSSPLYGYIDTDKPVRISAVYAGTTYPLYYGFTSDIEADPTGRGNVHITAVDFFDKLERQSPIVTPAAGLTDAQILGLILDWFRWSDPAMRHLTTGDTINASFTRADGTRSGVALVEELMDAARGLVFVNNAGAVTFLDRNARYAAASVGAIDKTMTAFQVGRSNANIVNQWTVQRTDMDGNNVGVAQTWPDPAAGLTVSQTKHGTIAQTITTPYLNSDNQALSLAQFLIMRTESGFSLVYEIPIDVADDATMQQVLARDLGDRVTLTIQPRNMPELTADFFIESLNHVVQTQGTRRHAATWRVSLVPPQTPFQFGISTFGGSNTLWY